MKYNAIPHNIIRALLAPKRAILGNRRKKSTRRAAEITQNPYFCDVIQIFVTIMERRGGCRDPFLAQLSSFFTLHPYKPHFWGQTDPTQWDHNSKDNRTIHKWSGLQSSLSGKDGRVAQRQILYKSLTNVLLSRTPSVRREILFSFIVVNTCILHDIHTDRS